MEQITIRGKNKARWLRELLNSLDFVDLVEANEENKQNDNADFFALAGIWQDREISLDSLRQKAWPRRK